MILCASWYHPVHVSVTNMDVDPASGMIKVSIKMFSDDFEDLIEQKYGVKLHITSGEDPGNRIGAVNRYIAESLQCRVNGRDSIILEYTESRVSEEAIWLYYTCEHGERIRRLLINNRLMLDKFKDQTNLVIVCYQDVQNGYRLNNKNTELSLNIR